MKNERVYLRIQIKKIPHRLLPKGLAKSSGAVSGNLFSYAASELKHSGQRPDDFGLIDINTQVFKS